LTVVIAQRPAGADQIGDLKAQARAISQTLVQDQLQIDAYQQQYSVISAKVAADAQAIAQLGQQIDVDEAQFNKDTLEVRQLAITSYMNGGVLTGADASLFSGNSEEVQSAREYDSIATGNIDTALDQLQGAQQTLQANEATLRQQQTQDQSNETQEADALSQANATQHAMELEQAQVTGQLANAITAQAAALDEAAAAALAKAQKVAKSGSGSGAASGIGPGAGSDLGAVPVVSIPDPALNPFLQCVVQAESRGNYQAVSPNGLYMGAFQFSQSTWNLAALAAALSILVNVPPDRATKAEQDTLAVVLYSLDGERPWLGDRCS
jgi:Transglycosylase-like domain